MKFNYGLPWKKILSDARGCGSRSTNKKDLFHISIYELNSREMYIV